MTGSPLFQWPETVLPAWIDYNGHMNVAHYVAVFDRATEAFMNSVGIDEAYRKAGRSTFAVEQHIVYQRELHAEARIVVAVRLAAVDEKRVLLFHELTPADEGWLAATCELLCLHVDFVARKAQPFPPELRARFESVAATHDAAPLTHKIGRAIKVPGS
jgi:acyl-CoA thioester hydrolase